MTNLCVGMIAWRVVEPLTMVSLLDSVRDFPGQVGYDIHAGDALVTRARSQVATRFLRDRTEDVLVTVDSDITFNPPNLVQMAEQAHELQAIVVAAYSTRTWGAEGQLTSYLGDEGILFFNDPTPKEILWGASGFMAIDRSVLERMRDELPLPLLHASGTKHQQYWPFYETRRHTAPSGDEVELSEDYDFCFKAAQVGVKTYVNPAVRLGHIGSQVFRLEHQVWKEPPNVPLRLVKQGIWEAGFAPEHAPFVRMQAVHEEPQLSRQQRRAMEREQKKLVHA